MPKTIIDPVAHEVLTDHIRSAFAGDQTVSVAELGNNETPNLPSGRDARGGLYVFVQLGKFVERAEADALGADGYLDRERRGQFMVYLFARRGSGEEALADGLKKIAAALRTSTVAGEVGGEATYIDLIDQIYVDDEVEERAGGYASATIYQRYVRYFTPSA